MHENQIHDFRPNAQPEEINHVLLATLRKSEFAIAFSINAFNSIGWYKIFLLKNGAWKKVILPVGNYAEIWNKGAVRAIVNMEVSVCTHDESIEFLNKLKKYQAFNLPEFSDVVDDCDLRLELSDHAFYSILIYHKDHIRKITYEPLTMINELPECESLINIQQMDSIKTLFENNWTE